LFIKSGAADDFWTAIGKNAGDFSTLTWGNLFLRNLLPVTLGNIIGGALLVGGAYWFIYLRKQA
jgi:formate transporter